MIVEDSNTTREMLIYSFAAESDIEVVGVAQDGQEAVAMAKTLRPNVILMDINMPRLNGYEASRIIMNESPTPILLMSATWDIGEVEKIVNSMHIGILGVYEKPYGPGHPQYKALYDRIVEDVRLMSDVKVIRRLGNNVKKEESDIKPKQNVKDERNYRVVLIGSSTGGPPILHTILKSLDSNYPLPILVAQHMSGSFIDTFIQWLDSECAVRVKKAEDGEKALAGNVYVAPENYHITLQNDRIRLLKADENDLYVPSVSKLFSSVSQWNAQETVAILLSGMGSDGSDEICKLKLNGAIAIAQNKETSVVFGMANEAIKKGGIDFILSPQGIAEFLSALKLTKRKRNE